MATSSTSTVGSQQYPYPSHVNAASFVSIKLADKSNYPAWKAQMMCLVHGHDMLGFIHGTVKEPQLQECDDSKDMADDPAFEAMHREWERSDNLMKGWIFGSLSEDVMITVADLLTSHDVWKELLAKYTATPNKNTICVTEETEMEINFHNTLCRALQTGDWETAQAFLRDQDALTAKLNSEGHRSLHVAIGNPKDTEVLTHLLEHIGPSQLPHLVDNIKQNALHFAAVLGNTKAAKELVEKNRDLLVTTDQDNWLPIHKAIFNSHETTFKYLLKEHLNETEESNSFFSSERGAFLLYEIIIEGLLDVAYDLLMRYPNLAVTVYPGLLPPLYSIATKHDSYLSAKHYNFFQRFFISRFDKYDPLCRALKEGDWMEARNFLNLPDNSMGSNAIHFANEMPTDIENQGRNRANTVTKCTRSYINHVIERIIGKSWEVSVIHLPYIKHLKKDKVEHNIALMILKFICEKVDDELSSRHEQHYREAYFKALKNNTQEAVEQITRTFPQSILMMNSDHHMLSHLSIINRSEKIYNFFVHEVTHNKYLHIVATDNNSNNLLHLAGQLVPTHILNRVTGAALQMQRELQWFKEVNKLMRPKDREALNNEEQTPIMVFRKAHAGLQKQGEEWTKTVANSYIVTAALIITIVFSAVINVPGGINQNTGKPTFESMSSFMVFLVSDAISLFTATVSLLFFLSILTARHAEEDFLHILPMKLICGLVMLFISVTTMLIAFSATLLIMFVQETMSILIIIGIIACVPILTFMLLQLPLLNDLIVSTYGGGIFQK